MPKQVKRSDVVNALKQRMGRLQLPRAEIADKLARASLNEVPLSVALGDTLLDKLTADVMDELNDQLGISPDGVYLIE